MMRRYLPKKVTIATFPCWTVTNAPNAVKIIKRMITNKKIDPIAMVYILVKGRNKVESK
jgi:hypothetical protein